MRILSANPSEMVARDCAEVCSWGSTTTGCVSVSATDLVSCLLPWIKVIIKRDIIIHWWSRAGGTYIRALRIINMD